MSEAFLYQKCVSIQGGTGLKSANRAKRQFIAIVVSSVKARKIRSN